MLAQPVELNPRRVALHHALRVADENIGRVVVGGVDERLHLHRAALAQTLGKVPRNHDPHFRVAVVECPGHGGIAIYDTDYMKILAGLETFEQILTLLAAVLVVNINGQAFEIETDAIAKEQHERNRHDDYDGEAARVAQDVQHFFAGHGQ